MPTKHNANAKIHTDSHSRNKYISRQRKKIEAAARTTRANKTRNKYNKNIAKNTNTAKTKKKYVHVHISYINNNMSRDLAEKIIEKKSEEDCRKEVKFLNLSAYRPPVTTSSPFIVEAYIHAQRQNSQPYLKCECSAD